MRLRCLLLAACLLLPALTRAGEVSVAVAANFAAPMQRIAEAFERSTGHRAIVSLGSTGRFHSQIRQGAPFQMLLAADERTPRMLEQEGLAVSGSRFTYAVGRLVLWSATPGRVDPQGDILRQGPIQRLAIADPRLAPYGAAAIEVMQRLGVLQALQPVLVQGESVGQAFQFVATGNASLGFVALAQVQVLPPASQGSAWVVPAQLHTPLRQDAVILRRGQGQPAALALASFLRSDAAQAILRAYGYESR
jgi:molybdate transport system substrate-binding protein